MACDELTMKAFNKKISDAFKSLIKSGRPDIKDEKDKNLIPLIYVDLFENDYILNQVLDDNHVVLKGRKGTGKSTIFLQADNQLKKKKGNLPIYINLQSCYEEIRTTNSDLEKYYLYLNFFTEVLQTIESKITSLFPDKEIKELFNKIKDGEYLDAEFQRSLAITNTVQDDKNIQVAADKTKLGMNVSCTNSSTTQQNYITNEIRVFSINKILTKIKKILVKHKITKVYLLLDDFSELTYDNQKMIIDSLIAPIITSYNDTFVIKLAAYPHRIYMGTIDLTKIIPVSLDFYDVYEKTSSNYTQVEELGIDYVRRTIEKRIKVYTNEQLDLEEIFDINKASIKLYMKTLFYASSGIPRCLGYILTYCYLGSINKGRGISIPDINNASKKYFVDNQLSDFYNDVRFKQSFYDDKSILDQVAQKNLMDELIKKSKSIKREIVSSNKKGEVKKIFKETIEKYQKGIVTWLPTSHFYLTKDIENILQTLELYFIVTKFNEGSSRTAGQKVSYFGLNYGMCLEYGIDYGKPEFRRAYDYWRQDEFDFSDYIPHILYSIEIPICKSCNYEYSNEAEYNMVLKFHRCLKCGAENSVEKVNKFQEKLKVQIDTWKEKSLPDLHIDILRLLYNNIDTSLSAYDIGSELDKHHLAITNAMKNLIKKKLVSYEIKTKRYYRIEENAISQFFKDEV